METLNLAAVKHAWNGVTQAVGVESIRNEADYDHALAVIEALMAAVRGHPRHTLHGAIVWLTQMIENYESAAHPVPVLSGPDFLRSLMDEQGLRQSDIPEVGTQSVVSDVLGGKRLLNARQIAALARRFRVSADVFLS